MEKGQRQGRMPMEGNWDRDSRQEGVWIWEDHLMLLHVAAYKYD